MARGWNDFWLCWIAVDIVGVPLLFHSNYIPSGFLYIVYGGLVIYGFFVWLKASKVGTAHAVGTAGRGDRGDVGLSGPGGRRPGWSRWRLPSCLT